MKTRRSWRNQNRMWRIMGGVPAKPKRKRKPRFTKTVTPNTNWEKYCALFDAGRFTEALPIYAAHLKETKL